MLILAVDSSAMQASVALAEDDAVLGEFYMNTNQKHSKTLMTMTEKLLECTGIPISKIDLFAVTHGPGSFTGVRIGVSCVKGMALPFNAQCLGVSSLEALACGVKCTDKLICAVMDARCGQVYNALFRLKNGIPFRLTEDRVITAEKLADELKKYSEKILLVGDGASICSENPCFHDLQTYIFSLSNRASYVASAAFNNYKNSGTPETLLPVYLSIPQAQREYLKRTEETK